MRALVARQEHDRLSAAALLVALSVALLATVSAPTVGLFSGTTSNPANTLATGTSVWFDATGTAMSFCGGTNGSLDCSFGDRGRPATATAKFKLRNKNAASNAFTLSVVDGTGPAGISTLVTAKFQDTGTASQSLGGGAQDNVSLVLTTVAGTPAGTYTGAVLVTDTTTRTAAAVPLSVTVQ